MFDVETMTIRNKGYWYTNLRGDAEGIRYKSWGRYVLPVFCGLSSKYEYLFHGGASKSELASVLYYDGYLENEGLFQRNFDHGMLINNHTDPAGVILIIPQIFHGYSDRTMSSRNALGSVIYQKDMNSIMSDLMKLNIRYLSIISTDKRVNYHKHYTLIFEDDTFYKYFRLLFSDNSRKFYKIIYNGTNKEYSPSPYNVKGLPFVPMIETEKI